MSYYVGIEPRLSGREVSALNFRANSPALAINISSGLSVVPFVLFLTETFLQTKNSELGHKC